MDDDHLCGLGVFWSGRWLVLSFTVSESSMGGRVLEPVRHSGVALDCMLVLLADTPA